MQCKKASQCCSSGPRTSGASAKITVDETVLSLAAPSLPLNHFGRAFVVDLQAQIFKSDGQIPTVYPPRSFGLEFTGKFGSLGMLAIPPPIGVDRLITATCVAKTTMPARVLGRLKYRLKSGTRRSCRSMPSRRHCAPAMGFALRQKWPSPIGRILTQRAALGRRFQRDEDGTVRSTT